MSTPKNTLINLTAKQIHELHEFIGDMEDDCEIGIARAETAWTCNDTQTLQAPGLYAWDEEYPEEGVFGPLGGPPPFARIITRKDDPRFAAGVEVFPYDEANPKKRERMSWEELSSLAACRTPAFTAVGESSAGHGETIAPLRFLSEFDIHGELTNAADTPKPQE